MEFEPLLALYVIFPEPATHAALDVFRPLSNLLEAYRFRCRLVSVAPGN